MLQEWFCEVKDADIGPEAVASDITSWDYATRTGKEQKTVTETIKPTTDGTKTPSTA